MNNSLVSCCEKTNISEYKHFAVFDLVYGSWKLFPGMLKKKGGWKQSTCILTQYSITNYDELCFRQEDNKLSGKLARQFC